MAEAGSFARPGRPERVSPVALRALDDVLGTTAPVGARDLAVTGITHDSRGVQPGDLYAALRGAQTHGATFARQAAERGALAILTDPLGAALAGGSGLPAVVVADPRARLGAVASRVYGEPSARLAVYGITGTNGKTTTAYLLEAGLRAASRVTGLLGTIETRVAGEHLPAERTTPEAPDLQALLALMVERGVQAVAMEVSSHALALGRADGTHFAVGLFTNLSQDHLDFHPTMEDYYAAKASLFDAGRCDLAVVGVTDDWGRRLAAELRARSHGPRLVTVGSGPDADFYAEPGVVAGAGSTFTLRRTAGGPPLTGSVHLPGAFNVANAVLALVALLETGVDAASALRGVAGLPGVPGRLEQVDEGQPFLAVVDYAHTPEAVTTLLDTLRPLTSGRLIAVLGCGGDRDRGKRPLMGAAVARGADVAVLTDDNPRSEASGAILAAMLAGAETVPRPERAHLAVEPDRAAAVTLAVALARPGDTVVVAGKGHETGQEADGRIVAFDDRSVLRRALATLRADAQGAPA